MRETHINAPAAWDLNHSHLLSPALSQHEILYPATSSSTIPEPGFEPSSAACMCLVLAASDSCLVVEVERGKTPQGKEKRSG